MAGDLFPIKRYSKIGFRIYFLEIAKRSYGWGFISLKMLSNVQLGISLKRLKISATGDLFH